MQFTDENQGLSGALSAPGGITRDINNPLQTIESIKQDVAQAVERYKQGLISNAESYGERLKNVLSKAQAVKQKHQGKPYMTDELNSRLNGYISSLKSEISETEDELVEINNYDPVS